MKIAVPRDCPPTSFLCFDTCYFNKETIEEAIDLSYLSSLLFSALDKIIVQGYKALHLQYFFTSGHDEVKAWTIQVRANV
jgi:obg-like ATPase 1